LSVGQASRLSLKSIEWSQARRLSYNEVERNFPFDFFSARAATVVAKIHDCGFAGSCYQ